MRHRQLAWPARPALMFLAGLAMFAVSMPVMQAQTSLGQIAPRVVSADELARNPERYYGLRVSVSGSVEDVYNRSLFTVDDDRMWTASREVLVLNPRPVDRTMPDVEVAITGTLVRFTTDEIERRTNVRVNVSRDLLDRFEQRPVLIADTIRTASGLQMVAPDPLLNQDWDDSMRDMPRARRDMSAMAPVPVNSGELDDHPDRYLGRMVTVRQRVTDVYSRSFFTLRDDIVVIAPDLAKSVADDRYVTVTGEVMRFNVADIERRVRGYHVDVLPRHTDQFRDNLALVATSIRTDDGQELIGRR